MKTSLDGFAMRDEEESCQEWLLDFSLVVVASAMHKQKKGQMAYQGLESSSCQR